MAVRTSAGRTIVRALAGAAALLALAVAPAHADDAVSTFVCDNGKFEKPFLPWADVAHYVRVPGGTFEPGTASWTLTGGAAVSKPNEPFFITGSKNDKRSLFLPSGSTATSAPMCVGADHPDIRFMQLATGSAKLQVEVLSSGPFGTVTRALGHTSPALSASWHPSLPLVFVDGIIAPLSGGTESVVFRFSVVGDGSVTVDDVYVDPAVNR